MGCLIPILLQLGNIFNKPIMGLLESALVVIKIEYVPQAPIQVDRLDPWKAFLLMMITGFSANL